MQLETAKIECKLMKIGVFLVLVGHCHVEDDAVTINRFSFSRSGQNNQPDSWLQCREKKTLPKLEKVKIERKLMKIGLFHIGVGNCHLRDDIATISRFSLSRSGQNNQ